MRLKLWRVYEVSHRRVHASCPRFTPSNFASASYARTISRYVRKGTRSRDKRVKGEVTEVDRTAVCLLPSDSEVSPGVQLNLTIEHQISLK